MTVLPPHEIRPATEGDRGYIIDTWLQSYRSSPFAQKLPDFAYWSRFGHVGVVEAIIASPDTRIAVAGLPDDPRWCYGYAVWTHVPGLVLHYVFVKHEFRAIGEKGQGAFGRRLLDAAYGESDRYAALNLSHITPEFSRRLGRNPRTREPREIRFVNPYRGEKR